MQKIRIDFFVKMVYNMLRNQPEVAHMADDSFESELITVTDENGDEHELEVLGNLDYNGKTYYLFVPSNIDEMEVNDPDYGYIILESIFEGEDEVFLSIEDEDELNEVYAMFMTLMQDDDDEFAEEFDEETIQADLNQSEDEE